MNTTVNPEGKILTYDEEAFTNITQDKNNSYIKEKITNLKDESEKVAHVNKVEYKEALDILLEKLNPYFKYYEQFSEEEFKELYKASKNISGDIDINSGVQRRNLRAEKQEEEALSNEETLFNYTHYTDTKLLINLRNEPGYNSESMQAQVNLKINDIQKELIGLREFINFDEVKKLFKDLSISGNEKAKEFYDKIKLIFDLINEAVNNNITNLINLIMNEEIQSLSAIFDSSLNMERLRVFPVSLVEESTNLKTKLQGIYNVINTGGFKSKLASINEAITPFISKSHKLLDDIFQNVRALSKALKSTKSKLTEISTYYLNNTPNSFHGIIEESQNLLANYYLDEEELIFSNVDSLINNFTENLTKSIKEEQSKIDNLLEKLEDEEIIYVIENESEDDKNLLITNLKDIKVIINSIVEKVEELIKGEMNIKENGHLTSDKDIKSMTDSYNTDITEGLETALLLDNDESIDKDFDTSYGEFRQNYTKLMINDRKKLEEQSPFLDNTLEDTLFSNKDSLEKSVTNLGSQIIDSIKDENDDYLKKANAKIHDFLIKHNKTLNELMLNFTTVFS